MRIISWNILASEWIKGIYYPNISKKVLFDREARLKCILSILKKTDADIILLQEVMLNEYKAMKKHFAKNYYCSPLVPIQWKYGLTKTKKESESGNMTLCRHTLFSKQSKHSAVAPQHSALEFGVCTEFPELSILNVHLDDLSAQTRGKQLQKIEEVLYKKPKCILGGDFNQPYRKNSKLYHLPEFKVHNIECPTYYIKEKMNIDNILTRGFLKNEKINKEKEQKCMDYPFTMEEGIETYGSDHLPVIINI